jgi:hypothetical protein
MHIVSDQDVEDPALLIQRLYEQSNNSETGVNIDEARVLAALHQVEAVFHVMLHLLCCPLFI